MDNELIVTVCGMNPKDRWTLPEARLDETAEYLISAMIRQRQLKINQMRNNHEPVSLPAAPAASLPNRQTLPRNGFRRRGGHRHDVADVDKNCNQVNQ